MRICFVTTATEKIASYRIRTMQIGMALEKMGHEVIVSDGPIDADVVVFSKHFRPVEIEYAEGCKSKVVYDVCDDHFEDGKAGHYLHMLSLADVVTCSTEPLRDRIRHFTGQVAHVIPDPYEPGELLVPRAPSEQKRVLWFGHHANQRALRPLPDGYTLRVLSDKFSMIGEYVEWGPGVLDEQLAWCDVVILPQEDSAKGRAKSHNRATRALRAGRYVVASETPPSYAVYPIWRGDIVEGLEWAFGHPADAVAAIQRAQTVSEQYSPDAIAKRWLECV